MNFTDLEFEGAAKANSSRAIGTSRPAISNSHSDLRPEAYMITASQQQGATPSGQYLWRVPSPPHIHVPQFSEEENLGLPEYDGFGYEAEDAAILQRITRGNHVGVGIKDWKYEWRRKSQPILSFLWLGPSSAARDIQALKDENVTLLLAIRSTMTAQASLLSADKVARQLGIESAAIDVAGNPELIAAFPRAVKKINDHLISIYRLWLSHGGNPDGNNSPPGKVLVFCESGNERSATIVTAYLMNMYNLGLVKAVQYIQAQRFCVAFDDNLKNLLLNYQHILDAQKTVGVSFQQQPEGSVMSKRGRDEMNEDEDMLGEDVDDTARFSDRASFVPFVDYNQG